MQIHFPSRNYPLGSLPTKNQSGDGIMATKPAASKASAAKPGGKSAASKPTSKIAELAAVSAEAGEATAAKLVAQMRVKDLIDRVIAATDQSRKDVKIVVEAALAELSKALHAGEALNLPPLGKIRVANQRSDETGIAMTLKLRRNTEGAKDRKTDKEALAEVGEAG
jgi:nucleoid DNA-binding protein